MIILISNRNVREGKKNHKLFGEKLTKDQARPLRIAKATYEMVKDDPIDEDSIIYDDVRHQSFSAKWTLDLLSVAEHEAFFAELAAAANAGQEEAARPWLLFVHGNNQNTRKNLEKCRKLEEIHGVNVIAFSWPARPFSFLKRVLNLVAPPYRFPPLVEVIKRLIASKRRQYKKARANAEQSEPHLAAMFSMVHEAFFDRLEGAKPTLLVHSLGNYVVERAVRAGSLGEQRMFGNALFHQADVEHAVHAEWLNRSRFKNSETLTVTVNENDWVLFSAYVGNKGVKRLGQVDEALVGEGVTYFDLTEGERVGVKHNFFHMEASTNPHIHRLMHGLIVGETLDPGTLSGFTKRDGESVYDIESA